MGSKSESAFNLSVRAMLDYCLTDVYRVKVGEIERWGFLKLKKFRPTLIYKNVQGGGSLEDEDLEVHLKLKYLDNVKASYDPSFELADGLNLDEWDKYFNCENFNDKIVMGYILKTLPKLFLRYQEKLDEFFTNFYAVKITKSRSWVDFGGLRMGHVSAESLSGDIDFCAINFKKQYADFNFDCMTYERIWNKSNKSIFDIDQTRQNQLQYIKNDIEEVIHRIRRDSGVYKKNFSCYQNSNKYEAEAEKDLKILKNDKTYKKCDKEVAMRYKMFDSIVLAHKFFESDFHNAKNKKDINTISARIGNLLAYAMDCISNHSIYEFSEELKDMIFLFKKEVETQLKICNNKVKNLYPAID